jgi:hypothetical protein
MYAEQEHTHIGIHAYIVYYTCSYGGEGNTIINFKFDVIYINTVIVVPVYHY